MAVALGALLPAALALPAQASTNDSVDQSYVQTFWSSWQTSVPFMAQTFTAHVSGHLDRVSLPVYTPTGFARFTVSIRGVSSTGVPTATVAGSSPTFSGSASCCQLRDFGFSPTVSVTSGLSYSIVVQLLSGVLRWSDSGSADGYAGGREFIGGSASSWVTTSHGDFGFKEWVVSAGSNSAPLVAADQALFHVTEGTAPANTGTCSDPDGDSVALTASAGTVSSCTAGKWSWNAPASDEAAAQTVTVTADDGQGLTSTASFTYDVFAVAPTATILTDPVLAPEGSSVPFTGGATSPAAADNTAGFSYSWTVTANNATYASGSGTAFSFVPADDGTYLVTFKATDDGGMWGTATTTVVATNVAPSAAISSVTATAPLVTTAEETINFSGTFTDADKADAYVITWNFGDGATATGTTASHAYSAAGTYRVTFKVSDGEGGVGQASATVTVQTTQQAINSISAYVGSLPGLNAGQKNSLQAKLNAAAASAARGDSTASSNQLKAFLNELQADVNTGKVSAANAATLRSAVHAVQGGLGTLSRLLEWRPL